MSKKLGREGEKKLGRRVHKKPARRRAKKIINKKNVRNSYANNQAGCFCQINTSNKAVGKKMRYFKATLRQRIGSYKII